MKREYMDLFLSSVPIRSNAYIPFMQESHRQERKWAHRKMWKRYERFKIKQQCVVMVFEGVMYANPKTIELIERACK